MKPKYASFLSYVSCTPVFDPLCVLQVKGLVKQHIDSFNYFINVEVKNKPNMRVSYSCYSSILISV